MIYICFNPKMRTGITAKTFNGANNSFFVQIFNPHRADAVKLFFGFFTINPNK